MALHIITQKLGKHFLFNSNLYIDPKKIRQFRKYYQEILSKWSSNLSVPPKTSPTIASQIIWYNKRILVDKRSFYNTTIADRGINHVRELFDTNGAMKPWFVFKSEFRLSKNSHFYWIQLDNAIPKAWKENLYKGDKNFIFQYKILNNVLYLNEKLFKFKIISSPLFSLQFGK